MGIKYLHLNLKIWHLTLLLQDRARDGRVSGGIYFHACGIEPEVYMNPILLKPTTDRKIQVIVNGKSIGNMSGIEYGKFKTSLKPEIMKSYNYIRKNYDVSIIEGAGSPVEINIKGEDIANMKMAEMADAPVILVADIDREIESLFVHMMGLLCLWYSRGESKSKGSNYK